MKRYLIILLSLLVNLGFAQRGGHGHGHGGHATKHGHGAAHKKVVVVHRSPYRPAKVVVYHPAWGPHYTYHRRWVYFPGRNLYWDNWRNHWVFFNGTIWISQSAMPPGVNQTQLQKEKQKELPETNDDTDDVYKDNSTHKQSN